MQLLLFILKLKMLSFLI